MWGLLTLIPKLLGVFETWTTKVYDAKVAITTAKIGGDKEVAINLVKAAVASDQARVTALQTFAGSRPLMFIVIAFALPFIIFEWKVVVWDNVLQYFTHGNTDPIKGQVADWATTIIGFLFGAATTVALGNMYFNRKQ